MPRKTRQVTITQRNYEAALDEAVDTIFEMAARIKDWTWAELAEAAKLSTNTVDRLGKRVTRLPRWQTFWKLARAVGLKLSFVDARGQEVSVTTIKGWERDATKSAAKALVG